MGFDPQTLHRVRELEAMGVLPSVKIDARTPHDPERVPPNPEAVREFDSLHHLNHKRRAMVPKNGILKGRLGQVYDFVAQHEKVTARDVISGLGLTNYSARSAVERLHKIKKLDRRKIKCPGGYFESEYFLPKQEGL